MRKSLLLILLFFIFCEGFSQRNPVVFTLSGYVLDQSTGEKITGTLVHIPKLSKSTTTNRYGFYSISFSAMDSASVFFNAIGYDVENREIILKMDTRLDIGLKFNNTLSEVEIIGRKEDNQTRSTRMSTHQISKQAIEESPVLLGESDVLKTIQLLPGVKSGEEGSAGLYVRGGSPDQNLILLDGVPVYNVFHLFGFLSVFNTDAINDVKLIKGGIPARYGGRLSSVLDISLKEGNIKESQGVFSLSPIAGRFTYEAPVKKDVSSFIISARRTWLDALIAPLAGENFGYNFHDINLKYNSKINVNNRWYLSVYSGRDKYFINFKESGDKSTVNFKWGNFTSVLRWNSIINSKLFGNFSAYFSHYGQNQKFESKTDNIRHFRQNKSSIREWAFQSDFDYETANSHSIKFGHKLSFLKFKPEVTKLEGEGLNRRFGQDNVDAINADIYVEDDFEISNKFKINAGLRGSLFLVEDMSYTNLQPRFAMRYLVSPSISIKGSYTKMVQYRHLLTNSTIGAPNDLWVSSTKNTKPQDSDQIALGVAKEFKDNLLQLTMEGYYKKMNNLIDYAPGSTYLFGTNQTWEDKTVVGEGDSYGVELFINKKKGNITGWFGYTLSFTDRWFDEINNGERFPFKYDRRHDLSLLINYKFNDDKTLSLVFVYATGNAITLPVAKYRSSLPPLYESTRRANEGFKDFASHALANDRNNSRAPAYHRMDITYHTSKTKKKGNKRTWIFSLYNAYSRLNPTFLYESDGKVKQLSLFPIVPSITYRLEF